MSTTPDLGGAAAANPAPTPNPGRVVSPQLWRIAVFAVFLCNGLMLASWVSRLPGVRDLLGGEPSEMGALIFGLSAGSVLGLFAAAPVSIALGNRMSILATLVLGPVGLVIAGVGAVELGSFGVTFAGLAILGFSLGCCDVVMNVEGSRVERALGTTTLPLLHAGFSFGSVLGALGGTAAAQVGLRIDLHLGVVAVLTVGAVLIAVLGIPRGDRELVRTERTAAKAVRLEERSTLSFGQRMRARVSVIADVRLLLIGVVMLGMSFAEGGANDWIGLASVDGHRMTESEGALVLSTFLTAMTLMRIAGGRLVDRFGRVASIRASALLSVVGLAIFILAPAPWVVYAAAALWGLGCALGFPLGMSAAADDPARATERVAAVAVIGYFAFLVGPPALGLLAQHVGYLNTLWVIFGLVLLSFAAAPATKESGDRARPELDGTASGEPSDDVSPAAPSGERPAAG